MNVIGLDLSMTATGVAFADGTLTTWKPTVEGDLRLVEIADRTALLIDAETPDLAVIEDLPFNARAAGVVGMVHGVVRTALADRAVPVVLVPPATLKVYATGTGKAVKHDMQMALYKRTGLDVNDNECDAAWLRFLGFDLVGAPELALPQTHRRALDKLTRPSVAAA